MSEIFAGLTIIVLTFFGGYNWGKFDGRNQGEDETRNRVVLYCIEKPQLCKEEYNNIKTQQKLYKYQKPEIK
jgi:hypothetical protein